MSLNAATYLLDTNVLLAVLIAPERLSAEVRVRLEDRRNRILFSAASIWEVAIKRSLGRDDFDFRPEDIHALALETGLLELPVQSEHCHSLTDMPWHHRDPFDRLLVSQARAVPAYFLTSDSLLAKYSELVQVVALA